MPLGRVYSKIDIIDDMASNFSVNSLLSKLGEMLLISVMLYKLFNITDCIQYGSHLGTLGFCLYLF